ncbi:MAG TPA: M28 family peptidase [Puia sp.]|uniref:M28 family peptidase n=1 Tax=Puia sp. TaxID=2045100 RepID=UPI002BAB261C|nr:M28 family peptidase [Puia sp.]HVU96662.1 M28 family peptidase [Puia sp.]
MKKLLLWLSVFAASAAQAQKMPDPRPFAKTITAEDLKKHLFIVASADFEGRETATEGQRKAAAYIENDFRSLGLRPGNGDNYQLQYPVYQDSLESASLSVNGQSFVFNKDFFVPVSLDYSAEMGAADIVFAGYGLSDSTRDDYKNLNVKGKIVLVLGANPPGTQMPAGRAARRFFLARQEAAQKNGAAALLILQSTAPRNVREPKGNMSMTEYPRTLFPNTFYITDDVARAITRDDFSSVQNAGSLGKTYAAGVKLVVKKTTLHLQSSDVLGFLEGTDLKDQILVISAHYDHLGKRGNVIWYGADDDGSGTVSVLEIAEAFAKAKAAGKGPRRSVLFLANSGEEKGLFGSQYYSEHPTYPLDKTTADLNIDMIGRIDPNRKIGDSTNYVYVVGSDKLSTELKPISEGNNKKYSKLELDYKFDDPSDPEMIYYRSDHFNFARKGVPIIFYFDGIHKDYHQPSDTPDKINYDIMEKRARLVFFTAWEMANRNEMVKRDIALPNLSR